MSENCDAYIFPDYQEIDEPGGVRKNLYLLAGSTNDTDVLAALARSNDAMIRLRVAENTKASLMTLLLLSKDISLEVRLAVVDNPSVTYSMLCLLAIDSADDLRYAMAENGQLPASILCYLAQDSNPYVSWRAHKTLSRVMPRCDAGLTSDLVAKLGQEQRRAGGPNFHSSITVTN